FIMPGPTLLDAGRVRYRLLNTMLGGSFTSRLNQNLREAHGYTYGAGSRYTMEASTGYFVASSSVRADVTGKSLEEFLKELKRMRGGDISNEEVVKARETLRMSTIETFVGLGGVLAQSANLIAAGLPLETVTDDLAALQKAEASELNKMANAAIPLEKGVLVLVGDRDLIHAQIKDMGLPQPIELDTRGNPVASAQ
ncbi:MAG TPA: insulinase family protein, partial [Pirellulales bacterium]